MPRHRQHAGIIVRVTFASALPHRAVVAFCAAAATVLPANAKGLETASQGEIVAGARSCVASVGPAGLDQTRLVADGWSKGSIASKDGKPIDTSIILYGKGHLMLMSMQPQPGKPQLCTLLARIESVRAFAGIQTAFASTYGAPFKDDGKGDQFSQAPDHRFINLASTGSNDRPSVRVAVGYLSQESK